MVRDVTALERRLYYTGWYGIPGGPAHRSTKVHVVRRPDLETICGSRLSTAQQFQFVSAGITEKYVDCNRCIKAIKPIRAALEALR